MSDTTNAVEVGDMIVADLFALLIGGPISSSYGDAQLRQIGSNSPGVLRRLAQGFQGDPVGGLNVLTLAGAALRLAPPDLAQSCTFSVETSSVRMTTDGTVPTATVGLLLTAGVLYTLTGRQTLQAAQFFTVAAGGIVQANYYT